MATSMAGAVELDRETLLGMYERMVQIRTFEDLAGKNFAAGLVPGFVHLYAGEEAVAVGICSQLTDNDFITSTHRGHGHCIAKGVDIAGMVAELMGKSTGVCKGKGGSMHIADVEKGMLGANGIVGGGIPLACGAALTAKTLAHGRRRRLLLRRWRRQPGHVPRGPESRRDLESARGLCLRKQRLCRVDAGPLSLRRERHRQPRRRPMKFPAWSSTGSMSSPSTRLPPRRSRVPAGATVRRLLEAKTYRFYGHFQGDQVTYRTTEEVELYKQRDPIRGACARRLSIVALPAQTSWTRSTRASHSSSTMPGSTRRLRPSLSRKRLLPTFT